MADGLIFRSPLNPNSHHTAKQRDRASFPTRLLFQKGCIVGRTLDFGCGLGEDVRFLRDNGLDVTGFDPHYFTSEPEGTYDTILCNYVLNVLLPEEQSIVLMAVSELLGPRGTAYFTVRRDITAPGYRDHVVHKSRVYQCNVRLPYVSVFRNRHCEVYQYRHINSGHPDGTTACDFCSPDESWQLLTESALVYSVWAPQTDFPRGCLVIPKTHVSDYYDMSAKHQSACWFVARRVLSLLSRRANCTGFSLTVDASPIDQPSWKHTHIRILPHDGELQSPTVTSG